MFLYNFLIHVQKSQIPSNATTDKVHNWKNTVRYFYLQHSHPAGQGSEDRKGVIIPQHPLESAEQNPSRHTNIDTHTALEKHVQQICMQHMHSS